MLTPWRCRLIGAACLAAVSVAASSAASAGTIALCHAGLVTLGSFDRLIKEMRDARVDFQLELYGGVVHGFTEPKNGDDRTRSTAYDARADKKSWASMQALFDETFGARRQAAQK